jgi:mannose-6-phosphate isomerase-like protein (cupin superfamily)
MSDPVPYVIRPADARPFMDGPEFCREYVRDRALWFGTSTLQPGQTGATDPGHPGSTEVFFCVQGQGVVAVGDCSFELHEGEALLIPPALPHTLSNTGSIPFIVTWAGAPGE